MQARIQAYIDQGASYSDEHHYKQAINCFSKAIKLDQQCEPALLARGFVYSQQKKYQNAIADFKAILNVNPHHVLARMYLASMLLVTKNYQNAINHYSKIIQLRDEKSAIHEVTNDIAVLAFINRSIIKRELGRWREANDDLLRAKAINSMHPAVLRALADKHYHAGNIEKAITLYSEIINKYGQANTQEVSKLQICNAYKERAGMYHRLGKISFAINDYNVLLELKPNDEQSYYQRGICYWYQNALQQALEDFAYAALSNEHPFYAQLMMIYVSYRLDKTRALPNFNAIFENAKIAHAYIYRGLIYQAGGYSVEAVEDYTQACQLFVPHHWLNLYAMLQLKKLEVNSCLNEEYIGKVSEKMTVTADSLVTTALAYQALRQYDPVKLRCTTIIHSFLPYAVSPLLRSDFIQLLVNKNAWPDTQLLMKEDEEWAMQYKDQLLCIIKNLDDKRLQLNAGLQAICHQTILGRIFYLNRDVLSSTDIMSGRVNHLAVYLNECAANLHDMTLSPSTQDALMSEAVFTSDFKEDIKKNYPNLYRLIKPYFSVQQPLKLFNSNKQNLSVQKKDEGNRFVFNCQL